MRSIEEISCSPRTSFFRFSSSEDQKYHFSMSKASVVLCSITKRVFCLDRLSGEHPIILGNHSVILAIFGSAIKGFVSFFSQALSQVLRWSDKFFHFYFKYYCLFKLLVLLLIIDQIVLRIILSLYFFVIIVTELLLGSFSLSFSTHPNQLRTHTPIKLELGYYDLNFSSNL